MTFVNFSLLFGAGMIAMPVVLHLIMRQKPKLLEFPALRFIQRRHDANRRRLQLRHLLLLALRVVLIGLVAFALARPSVKVAGGVLGGQKLPVAAAMVFDTSKRMEYRHENRTRLDVAQELGRWLLSQLPAESQVAVLDSRTGTATFQVDLGAAEHRMDKLETVANAQPLTASIEEAVRLLRNSPLERKEIYVFTDMARTAWPADGSAEFQERLASLDGLGIYVVDVGVSAPVNCGLGDLRLGATVLTERSPLEIQTELLSQGAHGRRTVELYLVEPDPDKKDGVSRRAQKRDERAVTLEVGQSQQIQFKVGGLGPGTHQGYLQILGQDGLGHDDRRWFTVEVRPAPQILIAADGPAGHNSLAEALAPERFRRTAQARFDVKVISLAELGKHPLDAYQVICVLDPGPLEPAVWQRLNDFAATGRGVALFLGRNAGLKPGDTDAFNSGPAQELLAGKLVREVRRPDGDIYLAPAAYEHPILARLRSYAGTIPWQSTPVFRYWQLDPLAAGATPVIPYNETDAAPAILERPVGKGRAITVTTPISDDPNRDPWNLLLLSDESAWPSFALVNEMMDYLVGAGRQQLNYFAGQTAVLELNPQQEFQSYVLRPPDGVEVKFTPDLKQHVLVITSTEEPGNYRVQAGGTEGGFDRGFSVNVATDQTRLERIDQGDLAKLFGPQPYRTAQSRDEIELNVSTGRVGRELFPLLILAAAVVLALEHIVANRFYQDH